ncbi:ATP-binding protein [Geodermatophilus sp. CPCC 206100]|uniref:ATP-binding protein n=1 Tax=Geodermatophilus sp. CPCC 206100 TaxID=3020054 RepID=UPI003AFFDE5E
MSLRSESYDFAPTLRSLPVARRLVRELLRSWGAPHDVEDAASLVAELVANVVHHVGGEAPFTLELALAGPRLRIAVVDGSAERPVVRELRSTGARGRGLRLVDSIAERWGVEDHPGGKRVWFDLAGVVREFADSGSRGRAERP